LELRDPETGEIRIKSQRCLKVAKYKDSLKYSLLVWTYLDYHIDEPLVYREQLDGDDPNLEELIIKANCHREQPCNYKIVIRPGYKKFRNNPMTKL
jgi:hypothetical protein